MNTHATISTRESADDYHKVVAQLNARWRVIECADGVQWILQHRTASESKPTSHWKSRSYCRDREALRRCGREHAGIDRTTMDAATAFLPERCS
jgi:hypothetical protein